MFCSHYIFNIPIQHRSSCNFDILLTSLQRIFIDSNYRAQLIASPINGRQSSSPYYKNFEDLYRSDHIAFWESIRSYSALMLTDTANLRGYMEQCYHKPCDDISQVQEDDLEFLRKSINAVIKTVLDLSGAGKLVT